MTNILPLHKLPRVNPKAAVADYLANVLHARKHDCGECLEGLSDADHMLQWLAERGVMLVGTRGGAR